MARSIRSTTSRKSRNWGIRSGSTYTTLPASGVTIDANAVQNKQGYMAGFTTNGLKIVAGVTTFTGSAVTQTFTGLTLINHVIVTPSIDYSSVTMFAVTVVPGSAKDVSWPAAGVTNVAFYAKGIKGTVATSACSLNYLAIGS